MKSMWTGGKISPAYSIRVISALLVFLFVFVSMGCSGGGSGEDIPLGPGLPGSGFAQYDFEHPVWSPQGDHIIFSYHTDPYDYPDTLGLYRIDLGNSICSKIIPGDSKCPDEADYSPDCRWIVFSWHERILKATVDGDSLTQLTFRTIDEKDFSPSWSPAGDRIAYFRFMSGIHLMNTDGSRDVLLFAGHEPQWIDDTHLAFVRALKGIFIHDFDTGISEQVFWVQDGWIEIRTLAFNKKTSRFVFSVNSKTLRQPNLWRVDIDGENLMQLTTDGGDSGEWSPDGAKIVYVNTDIGNIWVMASDGSSKRPLLRE